MLDFKLVLLLLAFHSSLARNHTKLEKQLYAHLSRIKDCVKIKCPSVDKPVCIELIHNKSENGSPLYILMINKCEMKYANCLKNLTAKIAAKENCYPNKTLLEGKKRRKRQINDHKYRPHVSLGMGIIGSKLGPKKKNKKNLKGGGEKKITRHIKSNNSQNTENDLLKGESKFGEAFSNESNEFGEAFSNESYKFGEAFSNESNKFGEAFSNEVLNNEYSYDENKSEEYDNEGDIEEKYEDTDINDKDTRGTYIILEDPVGDDDLNDDEKVDTAENEADCPTVCPSSDVMVCARNQLGMYQTFLSACHMRMVMCKNTEESLELVTRLPCMMIAPYLSEKGLQPKGHIPGDVDDVLRFILCREMKQQSREDDPRCRGIDFAAANLFRVKKWTSDYVDY